MEKSEESRSRSNHEINENRDSENSSVDIGDEENPKERTVGEENKLSKNQLKKLKKSEEWKSKFEILKKAKKEKAKEKRRIQKMVIEEKKQKGLEITEEDMKKASRPRRGRGFRAEMKEKLTNAPTVIVDCSFDQYHGEKELISMARQLEYTINVNKTVGKPLKILVTGLSPQFRDVLVKR